MRVEVQDLSTRENRGSSFSSNNHLNRMVINTTLWNFKQRLKLKNDSSYAMMCKLQNILKGVVFKTHYVYHGIVPYIRTYPGYVRVSRKPSFAATRLIVKHVLHCMTNNIQKEIVKVINS